MEIYLFLPRYRVLCTGSRDKSGKYRFDIINGKIPLITGAEAVLLAAGFRDDDFYFGTRSFIVSSHQEIEVAISKSSEEEFIRFIKSGELEGITLDIKKREKIVEKRECGDARTGDFSSDYLISEGVQL